MSFIAMAVLLAGSGSAPYGEDSALSAGSAMTSRSCGFAASSRVAAKARSTQ